MVVNAKTNSPIRITKRTVFYELRKQFQYNYNFNMSTRSEIEKVTLPFPVPQTFFTGRLTL